ncbi:Crp/Fnr family transcriptional regulator [Parapedobacter indicus]|uniref:cAMP-binding domain of CRP or a regulatory subunit of cAMP-dependent protein kinases n=1 Tax=Parapedobacter indicus TaxID=1477437 RepID=A0A1I3IC92_9SPHI|nr:Crp/Fnr family transcriptional regulator [Parapedobacter indicus]PPL02098.1 CRP-like cAMP-binding protein [Parapedobacter indicus]SFI45373.1 cAMP-binding domain of CRP or a regulatory subunit of cAMP-dependent protein kinases [Parapedobacter indicus]
MNHQQTLNRALKGIGDFSQQQSALIGEHCAFLKVNKQETLLAAGQVCNAFLFLLTGACYQFRKTDADPNIIDLHLAGDCVVNQLSFISQQPSNETIAAYENSELLVLTIQSLHRLIALSPAFLQLAKLLQVSTLRAEFYDNAMTPAEKYHRVLDDKPQLIQIFPLKYIASYLKITPETLSRVRAAI